MVQYTQHHRQLRAENQQKAWASLLEILKIIITLSTAIVGAWAIIFSAGGKIPPDWKKWLIVFAIFSALLSMILSLFAIVNINRQIVGIARRLISNTELPKGRRLIIFFGNSSFFLFFISGVLVAAYVVLRAMSSPAGTAVNTQPPTQIQVTAEIDAKMQEIRAKIVSEIEAEFASLLRKMSVDKLELQAEIKAYHRNIGAIRPEHLQQLTGFELGSSVLTADIKAAVAAVCERLRSRDIHDDGILFAVGTTDRVPLGALARLRYESNFGLARARAEAVKSEITACGVSMPVLALVSGPRTTSERASRPAGDTGTAEDRAVDVWALWSWRDNP